jgi:hypothetical protein
MHYWGYVMEQMLEGSQRRMAADRRAEVHRRRTAARDDRRWSRTAPRD